VEKLYYQALWHVENFNNTKLVFPSFSTINKQARVGQRVIVLRSYHIETGVFGKSGVKPGLRNSDPPSKVKGEK